jgi:SulP family sulfate permease
LLSLAAGGLPVDTIGTRFGGIPSGLPAIHMPRFRPDLALTLLSPTLTVAMLGAIESLMSAVVADRMSGTRHNSNVELFAQGVANIVSPLVGGLPATGAIARTATNVRSGAKTPVAGMIHALMLLVILLVAAPLAAYIPMAVLAAILLVVAYNMGEWQEIPELWKQSWTDRSVWAVTFALTVLADLTVAVEAGMIQDFADKLQESGRTLLLCGAPPQPAWLMSQAEFHRHVGERNILPNVEAALNRAREIREDAA